MMQYYQDTAFRDLNRWFWWISPFYEDDEIPRRAKFKIVFRVMGVDILPLESVAIMTKLASVGCNRLILSRDIRMPPRSCKD